MDKKSLRIWAKEKRKELNMAQISTLLSKKLTQTVEYEKSTNIMLFYPLPDEVNLLSIMNDTEKKFFLPRINNQELECCPYEQNDKLSDSCFNTKEPVCKACSKTNIDMVVVPALACDKKKYRLGYGKGFYDRFLTDFNGFKVCCIPNELYVENVHPEKHDIKMDLIITD